MRAPGAPKAPRISVILPVRDSRATLGACLDSLAAQTLADHELVAVDDGSRDGSGEYLRERAAGDARIQVIAQPPRGLLAALGLALAAARAPLLARIDADDVAHPERLRLQADRLERDKSVDVVGCRVAATALPGAVPGEGMRAYVEWVNGLLDHEAMARDRFVESPIVHPSVAMRAEALRALGGYRDTGGPEDYDLWLRAFDAGLRFVKLDETLLEWRDSPGRLTRSDARYSPEAFRRAKVEALVRGPLQGRFVVVWGAARWARRSRGRFWTPRSASRPSWRSMRAGSARRSTERRSWGSTPWPTSPERCISRRWGSRARGSAFERRRRASASRTAAT